MGEAEGTLGFVQGPWVAASLPALRARRDWSFFHSNIVRPQHPMSSAVGWCSELIYPGSIAISEALTPPALSMVNIAAGHPNCPC